MKPFDPTKPAIMRNGRPVRVVAELERSDEYKYVCVGDLFNSGSESPYMVTATGKYFNKAPHAKESPYDVFGVTEQVKYTRLVALTGDEERPVATYHNLHLTPKFFRRVGEVDFIIEDGELVDIVFRKKESN